MVVSDLDGTLFDSDQPGYEVSRELQELIRAFQHKGKIFTIASGRPPVSCQSVVTQLEVNVPYISCNGAIIAERTGRIIYSKHFDANPWRPFFSDVLEAGGTVLLVYEGNSFYLKKTKAVTIYEKKEQITCLPAAKYMKVPQQNLPINKALLIGQVPVFLEQWNKLDEDLKRDCRYVISEHNYMEIIPEGVSKGESLRILKKHLGIGDSEVLAIGNHLNDRELLEEAGVGVAVANAQEELKRIARYITKEPFHWGVMETMRRVLANDFKK